MGERSDALRVCMVVHAYYEGDARVRRYAESLAVLGHRVEVLALRARDKPKREQLRGVEVHRLPLSRRRGGTLRYLFEYLWFTLLCGIVLTWRCRRYDVVHVHNMPDFLVFAGLLPRLLGRAVVLDVHDLMPEVYCSKFKTSVRHPGIWPIRVQEWLSHRFASACVFATERFRSEAVARGTVREGDSIACMNAADTTLFDAKRHPWRGPEDPARFSLLYLGTVSHRHGVDQCVRVLPLAAQRIPGIRLVIHCKLAEAEGKPLQELKDLAAELGVAERVEIGPPLLLQDVPAAMSRSSVGVFTPHQDVHIDMALSLKVPEFVAMGVPVVAVRTSIMQSLFRDDEVLLFEDGDHQRFADHLVHLFEDPDAGRAMAERAGRFTRERSWDNEFAGYVRLLERLTGRAVGAAPAAS
ncbi:MAG: glycosyltransferase [Planctomycetes bacterium]|nr:glycosyltransferase [Planctomycetota bacterium]